MIVSLLLEAVKQRGGAAVWTWVGLMLATWLTFAYGTDRPLKGTELLGAGFVYGVLVLAVSAVAARLKQRSAAAPKPPQKKKRR
jgi:hypothetical protein